MRIGLVLTFFKRPELAEKCIESLLQSDLSRLSFVYMHDDYSHDYRLSHIINDFSISLYEKNVPSIVHKSVKNVGIKKSLHRGFNNLFYLQDCFLCTNLDPDSEVKKDFLNKLIYLKEKFPDRIVSGFNCDHPQNPVLYVGDTYVERRHVNGINVMINKHDYEQIVLKGLNSSNNWDYSCTNDKNFIISCPSLCNHLGWNQSSMGHGLSGGGDRACDF